MSSYKTSFTVFGMLAAIFAHFLNGTKKEQELNSIFIKYQHIIGNSEYFSIDDLCVKTGQAKDEVVADFKRLMSAGMLPGASIDSGKTTLILSDYARIEYKNLLRNEQNRQEADKGLPQEAIDILQKGDEYIARIHMANDLIPGEAMSDKLDDLEVMMAMPLGILAYMKLSAPEFLTPSYGNAAGIMIMTVCLAVYAGCIALGKKITDISD